jgi:hypothetical protein
VSSIKKAALADGLSLGRKRPRSALQHLCCTAAYDEPSSAFNEKGSHRA